MSNEAHIDTNPEMSTEGSHITANKLTEQLQVMLTLLKNKTASVIKAHSRMQSGVPYVAPDGVAADIGRLMTTVQNATDEVDYVTLISKLYAQIRQLRFGGDSVVVIDDLICGFGFVVVTGFASLTEAAAWGRAFQKEEGDYPCWNALTLRPGKTPFTLNIIDDDVRDNPKREGVWIRRIYREGDSDIGSVNLIGPFANTDVMKGFVLRDVAARRSDEWQQVEVNLKIGPRVVSKEHYAQVYHQCYFTEEKDGLLAPKPALLGYSVSAIDLSDKGKSLADDEHPLPGYL